MVRLLPRRPNPAARRAKAVVVFVVWLDDPQRRSLSQRVVVSLSHFPQSVSNLETIS